MASRNPPGRPKGTPKTGGRKRGTPNKATVQIKEWAREFVEDAEGRAKLLEQYRAGQLNPTILTLVMHYAHGKPKEQVELTGADGGALTFSLNLNARDRDV